MKRRIIIYVGGFELPDKNAAAQRCISNAKIFRELGYKVIMVGVARSNNLSLEKSECFGFTCWSVPYPNDIKSWLKHITSLNPIDYLFEHEYKNRVFAVICYNHPAISQYRIKNIAKKNGALALADVTEWYSVSGNNFIHRVIKWIDITLRMRCVNYLMDGLITTSDFLTSFYKKKILIELPTLYDKSEHMMQNIEIKKSDGFMLVYAGSPFNVAQASRDRRLVKERLDLIIADLYKLHLDRLSFVLNIFGVTKEDYLKVYPEDLDKLEALNNKVSFKGRCSHQIVLENIVISDFTIFLRDITRVTKAGFPSKFAESITYGTPVITNLISNIEPYVIEGSNCFLLNIDDEDKRLQELSSILSLQPEEVFLAKKFCLDSVTFDFRAFTGKVGEVFDILKGENED